MIISYICLFVVSCIAISVSSEIPVKGYSCSQYDSCESKSRLRTCSCEPDCQVYGTCCQDIQKGALDDSFVCYHGRTSSPVFVKRSCPGDYKGHSGNVGGCLDDDADEMDIKNNLLVTSHKTKITYWNKLCALCNDEVKSDLQWWNIEVYCPPHAGVDRNLMRRNLTFDQDKNQWGLKKGEEFLPCIIKYAPPTYIDEVKHCTPNLISSCPSDYSNKDIAAKCTQYYAERKLPNSGTYYKNVHCAICHNADVGGLECPGLSSPEDDIEETDFRDMVEGVFTDKNWLNGKLFKCSRGHVYDPAREICRSHVEKNFTIPLPMIQNSADTCRKGYLAVLIILFAFIY